MVNSPGAGEADRRRIFAEIEKERLYQQKRWGNEADDSINTPWMWAAYIASYATQWMVGKFKLSRSDVDGFRAKMVKTAAIAVAAIESVDRQREDRGATFYEE